MAIMDNHIHLGVNVHSDPDPESVLHSFKSYGSRALNLQWGKPASETWWTQSGSQRKLDSDASVPVQSVHDPSTITVDRMDL